MKLITYFMEKFKTEDSRRNSNCFYNEFASKSFIDDISNCKKPSAADYKFYSFPDMFIIDFDDETYNNDKINIICDRLTDMNDKYKDCFSDDIYGIAVRLLYKDANGYTINRPFTPRSSTCLDNMYKFAPKRLIQMMVDMHYDNKIHINYMLETDRKFDYITKYTNLNFVNFEEKFYRFSVDCIKSDNIYKSENVEILVETINDQIEEKSITDCEKSFIYEVKNQNVNLIPCNQYLIKSLDGQNNVHTVYYNMFYGKVKKGNTILYGIFFYRCDNLVSAFVYSIDIDTKKIDVIYNDLLVVCTSQEKHWEDICSNEVRKRYFENENFVILDDFNSFVDNWKSNIDTDYILSDSCLIDISNAKSFENDFDFKLLQLMLPEKILYNGIEWERKDNYVSRNSENAGKYIHKVKNEDNELIVQLTLKFIDEVSRLDPFPMYVFLTTEEILNEVVIEKDIYDTNISDSSMTEGFAIFLNELENDEIATNYINYKNNKTLPIYIKHLKEYDNDCITDEELNKLRDNFTNEKIDLDEINSIVSKFMINVKNLAQNEIDYKELLKFSISNYTKLHKSIKKYFGDNIDDKIAVKIFELINKYNGECVPIAFEGAPGVGKTRTAKLFASLYKKKIKVLSPSDLKAPYVGQTGYKVADILYDASKTGDILLIDEAYNLQHDDFGREAIDMILPIMSGDRKSVVRRIKDENGKEKDEEFHLSQTPIIWFSGYSTELRKMISENKGLYRRIEYLSLVPPSIEDFVVLTATIFAKKIKNCKDIELINVYKRVYRIIFEEELDILDEKYGKIKNSSSQVLNTIKNYYQWGTNKEYEEYFANYVGVEKLCDSILALVSIDMSDDKIINLIEEIIEDKKNDIKKQLRAKLAIDYNYDFHIERDVVTKLEDVKGYSKEVASLRQIIDIISNKKMYYRKGVHLPKGILFVGKPGVGKTYIARAVAGELKKVEEEKTNKNISTAFIAISAAELNSSEKMKALFREADNYDQLVIFIDEIDAIGKKRNINEYRPLLLQLLKELDGFNERNNVFVMAATNEPDVLDPALVRAGRFDRVIELGNIDKEGRIEIIKYYFDKLGFAKNEGLGNVDIKSIMDVVEKETFSLVPAKIKQLFNDAYLMYIELENKPIEEWENLAIHRVKANITKESSAASKFICDFKECIERDEIGEINKNKKESKFDLSKNEGSSSTSVHEVGHAVISLSYGIIPFDKITIVPRGDALGYVKPAKDENNLTKEKLLQKIRILLGGRVVEELFYGNGNVSLGALNDIERATRIAEDMVTVYGMSEKLGPMVIKNYNNSYLGNSAVYTCSDSFRAEIESEIREILKIEYENTKQYYKDKKDIVEKLAKILFEKETMSGEEFKKEFDNIVGSTELL
ncbi:MAG: AAA family ATPase [Lachnospiraceae bacterium]|nr:AAA family ATPase [Lachnospiraceae bacterium]